MVVVLSNNEYVLSAVDDSSTLLTLGRKYYLWTRHESKPDMLTRVKRPTKFGQRIEKGNYWLFNVVAEARFTPGVHLSLISEKTHWRTYIIRGNFSLKLGESSLLTPTNERIARPAKKQLPILVPRVTTY